MRIIIAALLLAGAGARSAAAAAPNDAKLFKDWAVGCDNVRSCRAVALPKDGFEPGPLAVIDRAGGASEPTLAIAFSDEPPAGAFALRIDGATVPGGTMRGSTLRWSGAPALAAARQMVAGKSAEVRAGGRSWPLSLSGAAAALLYLDDQQRRVGAPSAFVRRGTRAEPPAPPAPPRVSAYSGPRTAPAPASLAGGVRSAKRPDCPDISPRAPMDQVIALDASHTLVLLECGSGAYNLSSQAFLVTRGDPAGARRLDLPGFDGGYVTNAGFEPRTGTLSAFSKGRGVGDCGTMNEWRWTGSAFAPALTRIMPDCRGVRPDWWITLYRAAG